MAEWRYREVKAHETPVVADLIRHCFIVSRGHVERTIDEVGISNYRLLQSGHQLAAATALIPMAQFFGGRPVPTTGVAGLGVAPEARGTGLATLFIEEILLELAEKGVALSTLYPASWQLYGRAGYNLGGENVAWQAEPVRMQARSRGLEVTPIFPDDAHLIRSLYARLAEQYPGHLERPMVMWKRILQDNDEPRRMWMIGSPQEARGYLVTSEHREPDGSGVLDVHDYCAADRVAALRILSFLRDHGAQVRYVRWRGSSRDQLANLLPERVATIHNYNSWFLRIVDVEKALLLRGYPKTLEAELHLEVRDEIIEKNNARFILNVADGKCIVRRGGRAHLRLSVKELASIYTRALSPLEMATIGDVAATEQALEIADLIFSGPTPWMQDAF